MGRKRTCGGGRDRGKKGARKTDRGKKRKKKQIETTIHVECKQTAMKKEMQHLFHTLPECGCLI